MRPMSSAIDAGSAEGQTVGAAALGKGVADRAALGAAAGLGLGADAGMPHAAGTSARRSAAARAS